MAVRKYSNTPLAIESRERYKNDLEYREYQKQKARKRYAKRIKHEVIKIDEVLYVTSKRFCKISDIKRTLLYSLMKDGIIKPHKWNKKSRKYLFHIGDAYLFRDNLNNFLENPHLYGFNRYNKSKLKEFMNKFTGKYDYQNKRIIEDKK